MKLKTNILLSAVVSISFSQLAFADNYQTQLDAQQRTMLSMQNRMMQMEDEMKKLQGQIDELNYKIQKQTSASFVTSTQDKAQSEKDLSVQTNTTEKTDNTKSTATSPISDGLKAVDPNAQDMYDKAYALIIDNKLQDAISAFSAYLDTYKDNKLTPNAWYWKGQAQYKLKDYNSARVSFLNVVRFASSQKRPDSLYKLGMISKMNGDAQKSMKYFELVIKTYPNDTAANFAKKELGL